MRLICPNCEAEYEVDDGVIPDGGREVICSSCKKSWFQAAAHKPDGQSDAEAPVSEAMPDPAPPESSNAHLDILREEAAREHQARRDEALGKTSPKPKAPETLSPQQPAAAKSDSTPAPSGPELDPEFVKEIERTVARSQLLPDIEEISSSLDADSASAKTQADVPPDQSKQRGRNFRMGFGSVLILANIMVLAYLYAPLIVEKYPQSQSYMIGYVEVVNDARLWLDQMTKMATKKMTGNSP